MKKLLICIVSLVSVAVTGCASWIPSIYKIDIQQGNVISQARLNQVQPGMTKRQVQFLMGTPLVQDPFHRNRWDYVYTMQRGHGKRKETRLTMLFKQDKLVRITGDLRPHPGAAAPGAGNQKAIEVHPTPGEHKGFFKRLLDDLGFGG